MISIIPVIISGLILFLIPNINPKIDAIIDNITKIQENLEESLFLIIITMI